MKASDLGLSPGNLKFNFHFETYDDFGFSPADVSPSDLFSGGVPFSYDGNNPRFRTDALAYDVLRSAPVRVYANTPFNGFSSDKGLLLLHRNNAPSAEAESISITVNHPSSGQLSL